MGYSQDANNNLSILENKIIENNILKLKIKIGYCPTMKKYINEIVDKDKFESIGFGSTAEALITLKSNYIDIALIGRIAKSYEIDENTKSQKLLNEERWTYISDNKIFIKETEIKHYKDQINLISWNDWQDNYELAIIFDKDGNKVEKYRLPILYFK